MYAIVSDLHCHNWSAFATANNDGVNSRLRIILDELLRAAEELKAANGRVMYIAGDLFHVRGSIAPSVLNPVIGTFTKIYSMGIEVIAIPGNHDLESKDSSSLTNAVEALGGAGVEVYSHTHIQRDPKQSVILIPWHDNIDMLKTELEDHVDPELDCIIHAPVDGVIPGIPEHGLTDQYLAGLGYKRVFAGHYHNHVNFGNGVYSIGATTHQTWGDVGAKAGFLLVDDKEVKYRASNAPKFIDLDPTLDVSEVPMVVDGNYVRVSLEISKESDVARMREFLEESGALGSVIHPIKKQASVSRTGATVKAGASLEQSVGEFVKEKKSKHEPELVSECMSILSEAGAV